MKRILSVFFIFIATGLLAFSLLQQGIAKESDKEKKKEEKKVEQVALQAQEVKEVKDLKDEKMEQAIPAEEEAGKEPAPPTLWDQFPPDIQIFKWGEQFRIQVTANPSTPKEKVGGISSIKLEKTDGTFLGYRPFNPDEARQAIFITDPAKIEVNEAKITIASEMDGEFSRIITLEHPADNSIPIEAPVPPGGGSAPQAAEKQEKGKKKGWLW